MQNHEYIQQNLCVVSRELISLNWNLCSSWALFTQLCKLHSRRPRGGQWGREKRLDESFQAQAEKPWTDSHGTISKRSSECWLLIWPKKCFVLLCPIGEKHLLGVPRGSSAHDWKLSSRLFSRPDWLPLGLRGCVSYSWRRIRKRSNRRQKSESGVSAFWALFWPKYSGKSARKDSSVR